LASEIVIVSATDFHYTRLTPRSRKDNFGEAVLGKLAELVETAEQIKADAITIPGDLFDRKGQVTVEETADVAGVLSKSNVPILGIMGNHDQIGYRLDSLPKTGYGVLVKAGLLHHLDDQPFFISRADTTVCVTGVSYQDGVDRGDRTAYFPERQQCDWQVHLVHGYLLDTKESVIEEFTPYSKVAGTEADCILSGHYHPEQKVKRVRNKRGGCILLCSGSVSRGALTSDNFDRIPKMAILRISKDGIKPSLRKFQSAKPPKDVLKFEEKKQKRERDTRLKSFAESLRDEASRMNEAYTPEDLVAIVADDMPDLPEDIEKDEVLLEAKRYLEEAGVGTEGG
jgi:predicted phosphodiesterase